MKLGFVIIYVDDVKKTLQFYKEAFGLKIRLEYEDGGTVLYGEMETEGAVLGFGSHEMGQETLNGKYQKVSPENQPFGQEIVFVDENVDAVYRKAVDTGASSISAPTENLEGKQ